MTVIKVIAGCIAAAGICTCAYLQNRKKKAQNVPEGKTKKEGGRTEAEASAAEDVQESTDAEPGQERSEGRPLHCERQAFQKQDTGTSKGVRTSCNAGSEAGDGKAPGKKGRFRRHRKVLLIGGAVVVAGAVIWLNRGALANFFLIGRDTVKTAVDTAGGEAVIRVIADPVKEAVEEIVPEGMTKIIDVSLHIRKLPLGQSASPQKVAEAIKRGIRLMPGYTIVDAYTKTMSA